MKKGLLAAAVLSSSLAMTQLPDGSIAPDFTVTDLNNNTHNLYDILDQGYTVIIDLNATWCGPCWNYHIGGALEDVWANHGPLGEPGVNSTTTDDVYVFMIESDNATTLADLNGTGGNTTGDWVTGTDFPIVDDASVGSAYALSYFPTIYTICPNRVLTESGQLSASAHYNVVGNCPVAATGTNMAVHAYTGDEQSCGGTINVTADFQNMGSDPVTSFTAEVREGATVLATQSFSGNLDTYDFTTLNFGSVSISGTSVDVVITTADAQSSDDQVTQSIAVAGATSMTVDVEVLTDDYANETYVWIENSAGTTVWSEGNEAIAGNFGTGSTTVPTDPTNPLSNNQLYTWTVNLPAVDCYTMYIGDYYGDGLGAAQWGGTDGSWTLKSNTGATLGNGFGDFGDEDLGLAQNDMPGSVNDNEFSRLVTFYPNPTDGNATIQLDNMGENVFVEVMNAVGAKVMQNNYGKVNVINFDGDALTPGMYTVRIIAGNNIATKKVVINK